MLGSLVHLYNVVKLSHWRKVVVADMRKITPGSGSPKACTECKSCNWLTMPVEFRDICRRGQPRSVSVSQCAEFKEFSPAHATAVNAKQMWRVLTFADRATSCGGNPPPNPNTNSRRSRRIECHRRIASRDPSFLGADSPALADQFIITADTRPTAHATIRGPARQFWGAFRRSVELRGD